MKRACALLAAVLPLAADIRLPSSMRLAGPVDDNLSSLGDEISHYPFGPGFGGGAIHGWLAIDFSPPQGRKARFRITWKTVGDEPVISFQSGHFIRARAVACFPSGVQASTGELDLATGAVSNLEVHAVFQNLLIAKTSRNNRFPLNSKGERFSVLFGDYPPIDFPFPLPFSDRPKTYTAAKFSSDASGNITGFEFRGATFLPLSAVPKVALMPTYSFGPRGATIVPGADGCLPGTTPADQCLTDERYPDGIVLPDNAYLSPILVLSTSELREAGAAPVNPPSMLTGGQAEAASAVASGRLWVAGGASGEEAATARVTVFDPARNQWSARPDLPRRAVQACAAASGNWLYVMGGRERPGAAPSASVESIDTVSGADWSPAPTLPIPLAEAACASVAGRIYVLGGVATGGVISSKAWVLDPASGWTSARDLPAPLAGAAAAVSGASIYLVNGSTDGTAATNRVFVLDTVSGAWTEAPPTGRAVYGASAAFLSGRLHLAGGRAAPGGPLDAGNVHYLTQAMQVLVGRTWFAGLEPPITAHGAASGVIGDVWYRAGGSISGGAGAMSTAAVQSYTAAAGWQISASEPLFVPEGVRNSAGLGGGPAELAPGALVSILGYHLSSVTAAAPAIAAAGTYFSTDLPAALGGVRVTVDGEPAGIVSVSPERVEFQVPYGLPAGRTPRTVRIAMSRDGVGAAPVAARLVDAAPGLYVYTHGETRSLVHLDGAGAIAWNADGGLNYGGKPARRGSVVTIRATGLGDVDPRPEPLQRTPRDTPAAVVQMPEVLIDGKAAAVQSARLVPGEAGIYEIRAVIPADSRAGLRVNVQIRAGGILSNRGVLVIE